MAFFDNSYANIYYEVYGDTGTPVVLVNGYTRPCRDFKQIASFLAKEGHRVLIFDNRGAGETRFSSLDSLEDIAFDVLSLADSFDFKKFHLIGFSMGGVVARILAHKNSERLMSLSLVSTPVGTEFVEDGSRKPWGASLESIEEKLQDYVAEEFFAKNKPLMRAMAKGILEKMQSGFQKGADSQRKALLATPSKFFSLKEISLPTLLLHGEEDKVISYEDFLKLREQKSDSEWISYEGAGHLLLIEKSKDLYKDLASFVGRSD